MPEFTRSYFGRSVDAYIMALPEPGFEGQAGLRFQNNTKVATGIQKLAQIYMITLLTAVGSRLLAPLEGTLLGNLVLGGVTPLEDRIRHIVNIANLEARQAIFNDQEDIIDQELEVAPDDELLTSSIVVDLQIPDRTQVNVTVMLETAAGDARLFVVPLPLVP